MRRDGFEADITGPGILEARLAIGGDVVEIEAGWLTDAHGDLLGAAISLGNGSPVADAEWDSEPGRWRWSFHRPDAERVRVRITARPGRRWEDVQDRFEAELDRSGTRSAGP